MDGFVVNVWTQSTVREEVKMQPETKLSPGDVVRLKSGHWPMTLGVHEPALASWRCYWLATDGTLVNGLIPEVCLEPVEE